MSTATISRVLNGSGFVSEELRSKILQAVEELNYSPDGVARSMARRQTHTLGLVVSDVTNPFFTQVARGVEDTGQRSGYSVVLCNTDENLDKERAYLSILREKRVDGIMLAVASTEVKHVQKLRAAGMHLVLLDRFLEDIDAPSVLVDNAAGVCEATRYLLDLGHRRIAIVTGTLTVTTAVERLAGYRQALAGAGLVVDPELIVSGHFTEEGGKAAGHRLWDLPVRPTAVISSNNVMTTGLLIALHSRGVRIPRDLSVISFDDLPYFQLLDHPLTVISQPTYELGQSACERLLALVQGRELAPDEHHFRFPTQLILRDSCRRIDA